MSVHSSPPARRAAVVEARLGGVVLATFVVHLGACVLSGHWTEVLWACHMAAAALGLGLLVGSDTLAGIGAFCILVGTPLWAIDVALGAPLAPTSILTHVSGWVVAIHKVSRGHLPVGLWWKTPLSLALLQNICRWVTPVELNINAAFEVYPSVAAWFPGYASYLLALLAGMIVVFLLLDRALAYFRPAAFHVSKPSIRRS